MKNTEEKSLYERICDYEVLEETQMEGYRKVVLKNRAGIIELRIPDHTPEEEKKYASDVTRALFEFAYPDEDWSKVGKLRVIV